MNVSYWIRVCFQRIGRLLGVLAANSAIVTSADLARWSHYLGCSLFDVLGGPELAQLLLRAMTRTRPLTTRETQVAAEILGDKAIQYERVRLAQGGVLGYIFQLNKNRAFSTWHTINMPEGREEDLPLLVHELTHTYQFERVGTVYMGQALLEQWKNGRAAYQYHGPEGLQAAQAAGKRYRDYNREQQGQITQDYCARLQAGEDTSAYAPFIDDLRAGRL